MSFTDDDVRALMDALGCRMGTYADDPVCWTHNAMPWEESGLCPTAHDGVAAIAPAIASRAVAGVVDLAEACESLRPRHPTWKSIAKNIRTALAHPVPTRPHGPDCVACNEGVTGFHRSRTDKHNNLRALCLGDRLSDTDAPPTLDYIGDDPQ